MTLEFAARLHLGVFEYDAAFEAGDEMVVLFGHSGAGKTITLAMIAGLLEPESGHIAIDGATVFDHETRTNVRPQQRATGYVVQDLALFPHMSVAENVMFGMDGGPGRQSRTRELLSMLRLEGFETRMPRTLSGGQQQRVALARALARDARILLLDEPFSALDESLRIDLRRELMEIKARLGITIVFVTHDLREAHLLADRLAVFDQGKLLQYGTRDEVFRTPRSRRVAELTGVANIFRGRVRCSDEGRTEVSCAGMTLRCASVGSASPGSNEPVDIAIRAERVILRRASAPTDQVSNFVQATLISEDAYGATHTLRFQPDDRESPVIEVEIAARPYEVLDVAHQKRWTLELPSDDLHMMPA